MDRRDFLKGSSAALGLGATTLAAATSAKAADDAAALSAPAVIPKRRTLRMVSLWPDAVTGPGDHVRRFAKRIEAATDGRWVIEIADEPITGAQAFKAVMTGDADLYVGHEHAHRELHPAFSYFAGLPCRTGMDIDKLNAWLIAAGGQELWDELAGEFNMKGLVIGHSGPAQGLFTRHPIHTCADYNSKRIAADGIAADVLSAVGAIAAPNMEVAAQDLYAALALDGVDAIGPYSRPPQSGDWHAAATHKPHWINAPLNNSGCAFTLGLRRSLWDGLPNSERISLTALASEALASSRAELLAEAISQMQTARVFSLPPKALPKAETELHPLERTAHQLARIAETIVADLSGHDDHARRINASYMAFKGPKPTLITA